MLAPGGDWGNQETTAVARIEGIPLVHDFTVVVPQLSCEFGVSQQFLRPQSGLHMHVLQIARPVWRDVDNRLGL